MAEPPVTTRAVHDSGSPNTPVTRVVIHATAGGQGYPLESDPGSAAATARYFQKASAGGSAHYIEDVGAEEHCLPDDVIGWHAPPNRGSVGIEICAEAFYTRDQWLSPEVWPAVQRAATRCRELCDRYGIPQVKLGPADLLAGRSGICGHVDVSLAWHQTTHTDPGPNFPWDRFMAEVTGSSAPAPAIPPVPGLPAWTLPAGHYYGDIKGPAKSHGGFYPSERPAIQAIQRRLIAKGYVPGVTDWRSGWADGVFQRPTVDAVARFQRAEMPRTQFFGQVWSDDYRQLAR